MCEHRGDQKILLIFVFLYKILMIFYKIDFKQYIAAFAFESF